MTGRLRQRSARLRRPPFIATPADGSKRPGLAIVGALLFAGFSLHYPDFSSGANLNTIALSSAFVLIASIGTMALLVSGHVDLSIGSQYALVSVVCAQVVVHTGSAVLGVLAALALGALLGLINGVLVLLLKVSPLIVTLATLGLYAGLAYVAGSGQAVVGLTASFVSIGTAKLAGVPLPAVIALLVFLLGAGALVCTVTGLRLYAIGSSPSAAMSVGVRVNRLVAGVFAVNGALIGLVALLSTAQLASGSPQVGVNFELNVLAAVILGGVAFAGGRGHPLGVLVSVATIGVLNTGLIYLGLADWWQQIAQGGLLLIALSADQLLVARRARRVRQGLGAQPLPRPAAPVAARRDRGSSGQIGVVLEVSDLTVRFAGVQALDGVSLSVRAGEVACLVGDNGAGKSTLAKVICGVVRPSAGVVTVGGVELTGRGAAVARRAGVETVFQELALCSDLNVADNLALGDEPRLRLLGLLPIRDVRRAEFIARSRLNELGVEIADLSRPVRVLSGGGRQLVQILRVMRPDVKLVIMDEPTSALGLNQAAEVRALARAIAAAGTPVLIITHDVEEVFEVADRVIVLERGQLVFDGPIDSVSRVELLRMMSGKGRTEAARIMEAVSVERRRIERDIHDGAQQGLVQAALTLNLASQQLRQSGNESVADLLTNSVDTLKTALVELRDLSRGLYPTLLMDEGLVPAVRLLADRSALPVEVQAPEIPRLPEGVELAAYFVTAEAITNAIKHAEATTVSVEISLEENMLVVVIGDDGCGGADESSGSGLRGLRDRVSHADGRLTVVSPAEAGTTVTARFPVSVAVG